MVNLRILPLREPLYSYTVSRSLLLFSAATDWRADDSQDRYEIGDLSNKFGMLDDKTKYTLQVGK